MLWLKKFRFIDGVIRMDAVNKFSIMVTADAGNTSLTELERYQIKESITKTLTDMSVTGIKVVILP